MNKALTASILAVTMFGAAAPALADPPRWAPAHGWRAKNGDIRYQRAENGVRYWRGDDGRYYCRRGDGTVGLLAGAALGMSSAVVRSVHCWAARSIRAVSGQRARSWALPQAPSSATNWPAGERAAADPSLRGG